MQDKHLIQDLASISKLPDASRDEWLERATDGVELLKKSFKTGSLILYASGPHFLIHSVLAPLASVSPPDHDDLDGAYLNSDDAWCIQRSYGGTEGHRVYLEPPLNHPGCKSLVGGEKLVFIRSFTGMNSYRPQIEISQKLVHALGVYYLDERSAYCRLDKKGDIEPVIMVYEKRTVDPWDSIRIVSISPHDMATYMALSGTALVTVFDFTRIVPGTFSSWEGAKEEQTQAPDLFFRHRMIPRHASYAHGHMVTRTSVTEEELIEDWKAEDDPKSKRYASFKIIDWKNGELVETSCSPEHIVNYFTKSDLPWEISPAFFRPDVLQKYKADPERYTFGDRSISCRNAWYLKTYDINEAGQVHTYIGYLADLPYEEQLYWQSFNVWPDGKISARAYQTDILGEFHTDDDPLDDLKAKVKDLDDDPPAWWQPRGEEMINAVFYPATDSVAEWGNELLALDQLLVEGFLGSGPIDFRPVA